MSKHIERIPLSRIERIAICVPPKAMTLEAAMRAQAAESDIGINGGYTTIATRRLSKSGRQRADGAAL